MEAIAGEMAMFEENVLRPASETGQKSDGRDRLAQAFLSEAPGSPFRLESAAQPAAGISGLTVDQHHHNPWSVGDNDRTTSSGFGSRLQAVPVPGLDLINPASVQPRSDILPRASGVAQEVNQEAIRMLKTETSRRVERAAGLSNRDPQKQIECDVDFKVFGYSSPMYSDLYKVLSSMSLPERRQAMTKYDGTHSQSMLDTLADGTRNSLSNQEMYQRIRGLLLQNDSPSSRTAVELHDRLTTLNTSRHNLDVNSEGAWLGRGFPAAVDGFFEGVSAFDEFRTNNHLVEAARKIRREDLPEIKAEHLRIYGRELHEMVADSRGLSEQSREELKKAGI